MKIIGIIILLVFILLLAFVLFRSWKIKRYNNEMSLLVSKLPPVTADYSTPEGAILMLEDAYRKRDIEAAVQSKDFVIEAQLMLKKMKVDFSNDPQILENTAKVLELSYRKHTKSSWPDFNNVQSFFSKREKYSENIVAVTEVCRYPDMGFSEQCLLVAETPKGWRVLNVSEK